MIPAYFHSDSNLLLSLYIIIRTRELSLQDYLYTRTLLLLYHASIMRHFVNYHKAPEEGEISSKMLNEKLDKNCILI
jgi:hypothetical protein